MKILNRSLFRLFLMALLVITGGCATVSKAPPEVSDLPKEGIYHKVRPGETLWRIAKLYGVDIRDIVRANRIPNMAMIERNQLIFIPGIKTPPDVKTEKLPPPKSNEFAWPIQGKILSYFGEKKQDRVNNGVDIETVAGDNICAARDGRVVFADHLNGYEYTVILDHGDGYFTVYTQNASLLVNVDDYVPKGSPIARVGKTGELAFLHFEIRRNSTADNPLYYLP